MIGLCFCKTKETVIFWCKLSKLIRWRICSPFGQLELSLIKRVCCSKNIKCKCFVIIKYTVQLIWVHSKDRDAETSGTCHVHFSYILEFLSELSVNVEQRTTVFQNLLLDLKIARSLDLCSSCRQVPECII